MRRESCIDRGVVGQVVVHSEDVRTEGLRRRRHGAGGLGTPSSSQDATERTTFKVRNGKGVDAKTGEEGEIYKYPFRAGTALH